MEGEYYMGSPRPSFSQRIWPIVRVLVLQIVLMMGIIGNLAGWLVFVLLVDRFEWLDIDFHGKTLETISPDGKILGMTVLFVANLFLVLLAWRWFERKGLKDLWMTFSRNDRQYLGWGLLAGICEVLLVFGVMIVFGIAKPSWGLIRVPERVIVMAIGWLFASSMIGPIAEEALIRGYWFQNIKLGWGAVAAVLFTSVLFGGLHLFNPNAALLGAINILLTGIMYAVSLLWFRSLWFPIGWHGAWNFAQFFIAGLPNSGISVSSLGLEGTTLFVSEVSGTPWLSGGDFGMEASLIKTVLLVGIIMGLLWFKRKRLVACVQAA